MKVRHQENLLAAEKFNMKKAGGIWNVFPPVFSLYCLSIQIQLLFHQVLGKDVAADAGKNTCHETENKGISHESSHKFRYFKTG